MTTTRHDETLRWMAIAAGALLLASCRSMNAPLRAVTTGALVHDTASEEGETRDSAGVTVETDVTTTIEGAEPAVGARTGRRPDVESAPPPLPRVSLVGHAAAIPLGARGSACRDGRCGIDGSAPAPRPIACRDGGCGSPRCRLHRPRHAGACQAGQCEPTGGAPIVPTVAIPIVGPCLVCDGGDHGKPAVARGRSGLENVTAGDTVARYRPAGPGPDPEDEACLESAACVVASNCTCVYAPRFSSVRLVTRPFEDAVPTGPRGVAIDTLVEAETSGQAARDKTQQWQPVASRLAQPGIAVEDRIPVLAVDKVQPPVLREAADGPVAHVLDLPVERVTNVEAPRLARKIDVPMAWTCVSGAQVTVNGEAADVLAVDHGVATLRIESPGRCELTLCKRAGSDSARPGEELDFTIFLLNSGDRPLTDITLADAVPGRLQVIDSSAVSNLPARISTEKAEDGSTVISWSFSGTLRPGEGGFVRFRTVVH